MRLIKVLNNGYSVHSWK